MNKTALANYLVEQYGYTPKAAKIIVDAIFNRIKTALISGERVHLDGFGVFSVKSRDAHNVRNPRTGEIIQIPESKRVHFKQYKSMKEALNQ